MTTTARPTRVGVVLGRTGTVTVPDKLRSWSQRRYVEAYDADPVIVWTRSADDGLVRVKLAGPLSARAYLATARAGDQHVVVWEADDVPLGQRPAELTAEGPR